MVKPGEKARRDIAALIAFVDSRQSIPHEWGREANDCVGYVLDAVEAMTGTKPAPKLKWSNRKAGLRVIRRLGSIEAGLDQFFVRIEPGMAMRGDIAGVADEEFGIHPAIVEGTTLVGPGEKGNRRLPRRAMIAAWSATKGKADE